MADHDKICSIVNAASMKLHDDLKADGCCMDCAAIYALAVALSNTYVMADEDDDKFLSRINEALLMFKGGLDMSKTGGHKVH